MKGKLEESESYSTPLINEERDSCCDSEFNDSKSSRVWYHENYKNCAAPNFSATIEAEGEAMDREAQPKSGAICRICLEHGVDSGDELIAPCQCKGSQQFVHRSCLDQWRSVKEGFAFAHCSTCRAQFHLRINFLEGSCWRNIKFRMFVARDAVLVFLAVQTIISMLGGLSYVCDMDGTFRKSIGHGWDHVFSNHPVLFYYCLGALTFFVLLGIVGLVLQCTSYSLQNSDRYSNSYSSSAQTGSTNCCSGPYFVDCSNSGLDSGDDCCAGVVVIAVIFIIIFAVIGIFYGIFAGTICLQRIWQKHHYILTKRELTKEYIVEDLGGQYTPPKLDEEHAARLRTLNLL